MKNEMIFTFFMIAIVLVSGCIEKKVEYVCPDSRIVSDSSLCVTTTPPTTITTTTMQIQDLTNYMQSEIQKYFPTSASAFYISGEGIEEQKTKGYQCWTDFYKQPCTAWVNSKGGEISSAVLVMARVLDFEDNKAPTLSQEISDIAKFGGVEKRTLSNGDIVIQSYDSSTQNSFLFEVKIPCKNRYWVTVSGQSTNSVSEGPFLAIANDVLKYCK